MAKEQGVERIAMTDSKIITYLLDKVGIQEIGIEPIF